MNTHKFHHINFFHSVPFDKVKKNSFEFSFYFCKKDFLSLGGRAAPAPPADGGAPIIKNLFSLNSHEHYIKFSKECQLFFWKKIFDIFFISIIFVKIFWKIICLIHPTKYNISFIIFADRNERIKKKFVYSKITH